MTAALDIYGFIVNDFVGNVNLAIIIGYILILIACIKSRQPIEAMILLALPYTILVYAKTHIAIIYLIAILIVSLILAVAINKFIKR